MMFILLIIVVMIVAWFALSYNGFIRLINQTKEAWADIDVQLKRRYDLIPNLVEAVKGYAAHESGVFEKVTEARAKALSAQGPAEKGKAENVLTGALKSVLAVAEAYPQLRAVESFANLQNELSDTENKIQAARRFYNGNVRDLNIKVETFPSNLIASLFHFVKQEFFQLEEGSVEKNPVQVKF
jgi:LemA protein